MKSDKLSSFALAIAAIVLLVVGAISYRDYLKAKYEKEFGVAAAQGQAVGVPQTNVPVPPQPQIQVNPPPQALPPTQNAGAISPAPPVPAPIPGNPQTNATAAPPLSPIQAAAQSRLSQYQEDLKTLQQENEIYRSKLEQSRNGSGTLPSGPIPSFPPPPTDPNIPASAVSAVPSMPANNPAAGASPSPLQQGQQAPGLSPKEIEAEFSALAEKIRKEASIAKVVEFDPEWAFLVLSGGRDRGIELDMRFAVRRGTEILGWVKVTEVEENRSVAQLMSGNKDSQTARKPAPGDDLIAFNLF